MGSQAVVEAQEAPKVAEAVRSLGIPVYLLYEISIWLVRTFERRRAAEEAELEAELAGGAAGGWKEPERRAEGGG